MIWSCVPQPVIGNIRQHRKFAWLPTRCASDNFKIWLEHFDVIEVYNGETWSWLMVMPVHLQARRRTALGKDARLKWLLFKARVNFPPTAKELK